MGPTQAVHAHDGASHSSIIRHVDGTLPEFQISGLGRLVHPRKSRADAEKSACEMPTLQM